MIRRNSVSEPNKLSDKTVPHPAHTVMGTGSVGALQLRWIADEILGVTRLQRETKPARPAIVSCMLDAANALTLAGLGCSGAAVFAAIGGDFHLAGLLMVGAYMADLFDGPLARATKHRSPELEHVGARLDSLADLVGCGVSPGVVVLVYAASNPWLACSAAALLGAAAIRLAYFDTYGLDDSGRYSGVPTDLVILFFTSLLLLEGSLNASMYANVLAFAALAAAVLMVSPIQVPKLTGVWYYYLPAVALMIAVSHALLFTR